MIEKLKGFFLVFMVVLLSFVFAAFGIGGQAEGCTSGGTTYVAKVYGETLSRGDFDAVRVLANFDRFRMNDSPETNNWVLEGLIERSLLAREARELGFTATEDDVMTRLVNDQTVRVTLGADAPAYIPQGEIPLPLTDKDGEFDADYARRYIQNGLRRSITEFAAAQVEEILAQRMRELVASSVVVGQQEVWESYAQKNDTATIKYVRFSPNEYRNDVRSDGLEAWMAKNDAAISAEYEKNKHRYTNLEEQVRARHILIKSNAGATDEEKELARKKAEGLRKRAVAGADFAQLAGKYSEDAGSKAKGGDLGFNARGRMVKPFDEAQFALDVGQISDVVESPFGFHVIKVEAKRKGDVPLQEAKREIAEDLYKDALASDVARKQAGKALTLWKNGDDEAIAKYLEKQADTASPFTPELKESRSFGKGDAPIPGLDAKQIIARVFELDEAGTIADEPVQVGNEWLIFKVTERSKPDREAFTDDVAASEAQQLRAEKEQQAIQLHVQLLREQAVADKALRVRSIPKAETPAQDG